MLNQTNQLQNRIDIGFVPIGLDMPYRIVCRNNPVNWVDPLGHMPQTEGEWLSLINDFINLGKLCKECKDIEKYLHGSDKGTGMHEKCMQCCGAIAAYYGGILKHSWRDTCLAILC